MVQGASRDTTNRRTTPCVAHSDRESDAVRSIGAQDVVDHDWAREVDVAAAARDILPF